MDNNSIIIGCQRGERTAQRLLFDKFYRFVYTVSFRYVKNHHDCEDVVLTVFNRIFKNINQVIEPSNGGFHKWVKTIAINESIRFLNKTSPIVYTESDQLLDLLDKEEPMESRGLEYSTEQILSTVNKMPEGYRRIFLLKVVDGLTHDEIAKYLCISRNTSKSQMLKARKYLSLELKKITSDEL